MKKAIVLLVAIWLLVPAMVPAGEDRGMDVTLKFSKNGEIESVQFDKAPPITNFNPINKRKLDGDLIRVIPIGEMITHKYTGTVMNGVHLRFPPLFCRVWDGKGDFTLVMKLAGVKLQPIEIQSGNVRFGQGTSKKGLLKDGGHGQLIDMKSLGSLLIFRGPNNEYNIDYFSWDRRVTSSPTNFR